MTRAEIRRISRESITNNGEVSIKSNVMASRVLEEVRGKERGDIGKAGDTRWTNTGIESRLEGDREREREGGREGLAG